MQSPYPFAASGISDQNKIRVVLFANNQTIHVPLTALLAPLQTEVDLIKERICNLEKKFNAPEKQ